MIATKLLLGAFSVVYVLWVLYLAIMVLATARDAGRLPKWALWFGYPLLGAGYALDFLANIFILTWLLAEVPREFLVTARLSRHIKAESGYRKAVATWICKNLLDFADPNGCHCR